MSKWNVFYASSFLDTVFEDSVERQYWSNLWQRLLQAGQPDTWDYQWTFTCLVNGGLTALPNRNLMNNVGFGQDATHTTGSGRGINTTIKNGIDLINHPSFVLRDCLADRYTFDHHYGGRYYRFPRSLIRRLKRVLAAAIRSIRSPMP